MVIHFPFSKTESVHGESQLRDRNLILAYLEALEEARTPLKLWYQEEDRVPMGATVIGVDEESMRVLLRLQRALPGDIALRHKLTLLFPLDGCRLSTHVRFLERSAYLEAYVTVPEVMRHAERRSKMRARFGAREKAIVTVFEGIEGNQRGAVGRLVDLSMEGLCMRLEKASSIMDDIPLRITPSLFTAGGRFSVVRIERLPSAPVVECSGRIAHVRETSDGVLLGICFDSPGEWETQILAEVMGRRLPRFNQGFPERERRSAEGLEAPPVEAPAEEPQEDTPLPAPAPEEVRTASETDPRLVRAARILAIRKKSKRIMLVMFDDLDRAILGATLKVDGYEKIHGARNYLEALAHFKVFNLDLVIIDQQLGTHTAQEFLVRLRKDGLCLNIPVVLLATEVDVKVKIMAKALGIDHIEQVPVDYDGRLREVVLDLLDIKSTLKKVDAGVSADEG